MTPISSGHCWYLNVCEKDNSAAKFSCTRHVSRLENSRGGVDKRGGHIHDAQCEKNRWGWINEGDTLMVDYRKNCILYYL